MVLQVRYKDTMTKREMNINSTVKASETTPATLLREEQEAAMTGGVDYSRMKEITQDMMTDELFATFQRGDTQTVHGMTSAVNPKARRPRSLTGAITREGATLVPLDIHFNERGRAKVLLGLAEGKKKHDKRAAIAERDWQRDKSRMMRNKGQE